MSSSSRPLTARQSNAFEDFLQANGRTLAIVGGAAILGVGGWYAYRWNRAGTETRAETAFFEALRSPADAAGQAAAERQLRQVATGYAGTAGGTQAALALAQLLFDQGKYQEGLAVLDGAKAPETLRDGVEVLRAAGLEGVGKPAEAAAIYQRLAGSVEAQTRKDELTASAARAYQLAGDRANALKAWQTLAEREGAPLADEARVRVGELSAAPAAR